MVGPFISSHLEVPMTSTSPIARPVLPDGAAVERSDRGLRHAAIGFVVAAMLHNADHLRRGFGATTVGVQALGWAGMALTALAVVLVLRGHRLAPLVAVSAGTGLAIGFLAVHWLPGWGEFSDSFVDGGAAVTSMVASLLEVAGAVWLAVAGWRALRARGGLASAARR